MTIVISTRASFDYSARLNHVRYYAYYSTCHAPDGRIVLSHQARELDRLLSPATWRIVAPGVKWPGNANKLVTIDRKKIIQLLECQIRI